VRRARHAPKLFRLFMTRVSTAGRAVFIQLQLRSRVLLIFIRRIIFSFALWAAQLQFNPHNYSVISETTPAPTVRPPSRIANRRPCSMAIGTISSTSKVELSPGITISTPSGRPTTPVTSVVRK